MKIGLYIHIPFCVSKCNYCDFVSFAHSESRIPAYIDALICEMKSRKDKASSVATVFIGGGTPSLVPPKDFRRLMDAVYDCFEVEKDAEITVECNPDSLSRAFASTLAASGVNRVSIGLQSNSDRLLELIGRPHRCKDFVTTLDRVRNVGITDINADIMLGLPTQSLFDVEQTLKLLAAKQLPHVSAYALKLERGTLLHKAVCAHSLEMPPDDLTADMYEMTLAALEARDVFRYEVSNFAQAKHESRHNLNYWNWGRYLGIGVAAHSFLGDVRSSNIQSLDNYIQRINEGKSVQSTSHKLSLNEAEWEYFMLAMRKTEGMDITAYNQMFYTDFIARYSQTIQRLERLGLIVYDENSINIRPEKMYLLNSILTEF
ncbi:MAG: radical SAM family heme chaperone HemW [Clostridia bacterium]|nr:radical SAM family heme chaperone HemW [Clostridia bacterium]